MLGSIFHPVFYLLYWQACCFSWKHQNQHSTHSKDTLRRFIAHMAVLYECKGLAAILSSVSPLWNEGGLASVTD